MSHASPDPCHANAARPAPRFDDWLIVFAMFGLAMFLAFSYFDGRVAKAVKASYVWMTPATAGVLLLMTAACIRNLLRRTAASCGCHPQATPRGGRLICLVILITPIVFSLVVNPRQLSLEGSRKRRTPAPALGADFNQALAWVAGEDVTADQTADGGKPLPPNPTVLDVFAATNGGGQRLDGQFVTLVGQCDLYGGPDSPRFDLYRLVVTCCIADASSVALEVTRPGNVRLESGAWVRARGNLRIDDGSGSPVPVLHATMIESIPEPSSPYL
jgi:putative membrane protein